MRPTKLLIPFLLFAISLSAQTHQNDLTLKAGIQNGMTTYEYLNAFGAVLKLDYGLSDRLELGSGLGFIRKNFIENGYSSGVDENGVAYSNTYQYTLKEQFSHLDITMQYTLFGRLSRNKFKVGAGPSLIVASFYYPKEAYVNKGIIEQITYTRHQAISPMLNVMISDDYNITDRLVLFGEAGFRTCFVEKSVVERRLIFPHGTLTSTSSIQSNYSITLGIGYRL